MNKPKYMLGTVLANPHNEVTITIVKIHRDGYYDLKFSNMKEIEKRYPCYIVDSSGFYPDSKLRRVLK